MISLFDYFVLGFIIIVFFPFVSVVFSGLFCHAFSFGHACLDMVPVSILRKSISGRHRPVRIADGPMTVRCRFT